MTSRGKLRFEAMRRTDFEQRMILFFENRDPKAGPAVYAEIRKATGIGKTTIPKVWRRLASMGLVPPMPDDTDRKEGLARLILAAVKEAGPSAPFTDLARQLGLGRHTIAKYWTRAAMAGLCEWPEGRVGLVKATPRAAAPGNPTERASAWHDHLEGESRQELCARWFREWRTIKARSSRKLRALAQSCAARDLALAAAD